MPRRAERSACVMLLASALLLAVLAATSAAGAPQSASGQGAGQQQQEERKRPVKPDLGEKSRQAPQKDFRIGVNVDMVVVHTTVVDKAGQFVGGLMKDNFKVFENNVGQDIVSFSQEDVPVSLGIVIDTSGSMRNKIDNVIKAALAFIKASNPDDQEFLIGFNSDVELLEDFTNDIDTISDDLNNIVVTGGTALYDAIYLAVQKAQAGIKPKKALVLITDGEDKDSYYSLDEMVAKVQESDVQIYSIGFLNEIPDKGLFGRWSKSEPEKARDALQRISEETGAKAFFPKNIAEIHPIIAEIAHELRSQYSISYISSNAARDGTWRRIRVALSAPNAGAMHVRYRSGYFAKPDAERNK